MVNGCDLEGSFFWVFLFKIYLNIFIVSSTKDCLEKGRSKDEAPTTLIPLATSPEEIKRG